MAFEPTVADSNGLFTYGGDRRVQACYAPHYRCNGGAAVVETLGQRIVRLRAERGLSQSQLATFAGVSQGYIWRLEAGQYKHPSADKLAAIARVLHVSLDELRGVPPPEEDELLDSELRLMLDWESVKTLTREEKISLRELVRFWKSTHGRGA